MRTRRRTPRRPLVVGTVLLVGGLVGCAPAPGPVAGPTAPPLATEDRVGQDGPGDGEAPGTSPTGNAASGDHRPPPPQDAGSRAVGHIHGLALDPVDGALLVGTHHGTFLLQDGRMTALGEVVDLMGFAASPDGRLLASGHPGPGSVLPDPIGLVESTDGGATWVPLSRQGESDFHALTASAEGVLGFDGRALRWSADGTAWDEVAIPEPPFDLAASPAGDLLVSTHGAGPMASTDGGQTWERWSAAPVLQLVHVLDGSTVVGVAPDGAVVVSVDTGLTWDRLGEVPGPPHALTAWQEPDGPVVVVAVGGAVLRLVAGGDPEVLATY